MQTEQGTMVLSTIVDISVRKRLGNVFTPPTVCCKRTFSF